MLYDRAMTSMLPNAQAVLKPTPQAEERLAEATLAVSSPPAGTDSHPAAANGAPLAADGDMDVPVDGAPAEVAAPQEPALKVSHDKNLLQPSVAHGALV